MKKLNKQKIAKRLTRAARDRKITQHQKRFGLDLQRKNAMKGPAMIFSRRSPPPLHAGAIMAAMLGGSLFDRR